MSKITNISNPPEEVQAWALCRLLHTKRPFRTGKRTYIESIQEWRDEIVWICDQCANKNDNHTDKPQRLHNSLT